MGRIIDLYCRILKCTIAVCLAVMVVLVFGNVVLRYAFNSGITVSEELSRWLMVWLTFLGAIVALREHAHLGVDTLVRALPPAGKRLCFVLSYGLMLYADWLLLAGSWRQTIITAGDRTPATNLSVGLFYGAGWRLPLSDMSGAASAMSPSWPHASCPRCQAPQSRTPRRSPPSSSR